jgi:hypothetical protein
MNLPEPVYLFQPATNRFVKAEIVLLPPWMTQRRMSRFWWDDRGLDRAAAAEEIDRNWYWSNTRILRNGWPLLSRKIGIQTGDFEIQAAAMFAVDPVWSEVNASQRAVFIEALAAAPRNRSWVRRDGSEKFRGVCFHLLRWIVRFSAEQGLDGRVKVDASASAVKWFASYGFKKTFSEPLEREGRHYFAMELTPRAAAEIVPDLRATRMARGRG